MQATCYPIPLDRSPSVEPWAAMDLAQLLERVRELADAEGVPLREAARKFTAVQVPDSKTTLAWNWHPWLGFTPRR